MNADKDDWNHLATRPPQSESALPAHTNHPVVTTVVFSAAEIIIMTAIANCPVNIVLLVMTDLKQQHTTRFEITMGRADNFFKASKAVIISIKR